ncbi:branched-chain amino acid ABC transporter permease [Bradyrhizobium sp. U87765 SZCCT0131]|uniref:branched-chain amino acid ABC transporter permease n=1 Tax=unclassified Bradyrhizobium TaxID=2631580 RepID=UPI001BA5FEE8|nr:MULTISPECIES: branched-chain amino acid ABC transporter permease [unclassified Bradyrhizobium]MBR1221363.1 branched-chain amino acid ABC transporter permease [Bradyrhizobium sp. U87765 SZCCT0131]MBR1264714.1 branched-chain amino acid ABC transporter permease [Bradyrhizobium sp. U87765 SZCCT0134]MBR1304380.1 branched-chain amino acid ABC transporter permease [Bradyrhizobium sp. U87765 SZCCT0110]MBR1322763.1 branched-chain amino acid ABC transporter permease [Bradyrhizobium sp. U87765 SZCCT010
MGAALFIEQSLNGLQLGVQLFLMAAGLTLVFGIMNMINLTHGSLFMIGAFLAAAVLARTGSFMVALVVAVPATALAGALLEAAVLRRFYHRGHLDQVLVTFGLIMVLNEVVRMVWGAVPVPMALPSLLSGAVTVAPGVVYPSFRLAILGVGIIVAIALYFIVVHTRIGMWVRAGASNRDIASAMGVNVELIFLLVFAAGAALAGLAGIMAGPISAVQVGMGEPVLILALVVTVIGGIGSIKGAFIAAILIGVVDTFGRVLLPPALGSMLIFMMMAAILAWRPRGLFPVHS